MKKPGEAERSYFRWGLEELERRLGDYCEAGYDEYETINMFIHEMDNYACENRNTSVMFSCAADAGRYVLDNSLIHYI